MQYIAYVTTYFFQRSDRCYLTLSVRSRITNLNFLYKAIVYIILIIISKFRYSDFSKHCAFYSLTFIALHDLVVYSGSYNLCMLNLMTKRSICKILFSTNLGYITNLKLGHYVSNICVDIRLHYNTLNTPFHKHNTIILRINEN